MFPLIASFALRILWWLFGHQPANRFYTLPKRITLYLQCACKVRTLKHLWNKELKATSKQQLKAHLCNCYCTPSSNKELIVLSSPCRSIALHQDKPFFVFFRAPSKRMLPQRAVFCRVNFTITLHNETT